MAKKKKKVTPHNTGLSIKRSGNKFTASWKIATSSVNYQKLAYRTHNGQKWSGYKYVKLSTKATSYSFSLSNSGSLTQIQVKISTRRSSTKTITYTASSYNSCAATWKANAPATPGITVNADGSNKTTFSWDISVSDTDTYWFYATYYRTKVDSGAWSDWVQSSAQNSASYTEERIGVTRYFELKSKGPAGYSGTRSASRYIGPPPVPTWPSSNPVSYSLVSESYYSMTYNCNVSGSTATVDSIVPQYFIGSPDASMGVPPSSSWNNGIEYIFSNGKSAYALSVSTEKIVEADECLWARVKTDHDSLNSFSVAYRVITGRLSVPSVTVSVPATPNASGFTANVDIDNSNTSVPGVYQEVYLEKYSATGVENYILIGTIASGTGTASITSDIDLTHEKGYAIHVRNVTADGKSMTSDYTVFKTTMPTSPELNSVTATTSSGKVLVTWTNEWRDATGTVIAWTEDPDDWMSNKEPESYEVKELASSWFIAGLATGTTWYFRVRSERVDGDNISYSSWSNEIAIDLASAPATPVLFLSEETITEKGMVTAYWSYVTTDGTAQIAGEVVTASNDGENWTYGDAVGTVTEAQHVDIYAEEQGWTNGSVVYLALRTRSASGGMSEYSTPIALVIAAKPTVEISKTGLSEDADITEHISGDGAALEHTLSHRITSDPVVTVDGVAAEVTYSDDRITFTEAPAEGADISVTYKASDIRVLTTLPLEVTINSTGASTVSLVIERAEPYPMLRPDGTETDGAAGEAVYVNTVSGDAVNVFTVNLDNLIGRLDDGAYYRMVATASDSYGQSAEADMRFLVGWNHQAWIPDGRFITDSDEFIAYITPLSVEGYAEGDTCDIYRLGADQPELIVSGGRFGETYVDPYPAFGDLSGYKIVTVTQYGDYITADGQVACIDSTEDEGIAYGQIDPGSLVIDFGADQIELPYNIALDNSWEKDFERTAYLGGHVAGDHNRAVLRDISADTVLIRGADEDIASRVRELARYPGVCHVRTPEGSSIAADVQVSESRSYDDPLVSYSLTISAVDTEGYDGMTAEEWEETQR